MNKFLPLAILPVVLCQCANTPPPADEVTQRFVSGISEDTAKAGADTSRIRVPILRAPALEARGIRPRWTIAADGSYIARYDDGHDYLEIVGTTRPVKREAFAYPGSLEVLGHRVSYYDSGNEDPELRTEPVQLTAPDGRGATYCLVFGGVKPGIAKRVPAVGW